MRSLDACLDSGITRFDTTNHQERLAPGQVLRELGCREEVKIAVWNFFAQAGKEDVLAPWTSHESHHMDLMLSELQTDSIDILVIHAGTTRACRNGRSVWWRSEYTCDDTMSLGSPSQELHK